MDIMCSMFHTDRLDLHVLSSSKGISFFKSALHEVKRDYNIDFFFNPHELTKIVLESSTKFYGTKLNNLA